MVGTTVKKVMGSFVGPCSLSFSRNGTASLSHTAVGLKGYINSMADPANSGVRRAFTVP